MSIFVVNIKTDGKLMGVNSLISIGVVKLQKSGVTSTFYRKLKPITEEWDQDYLNRADTSREQHLTYEDPWTVIKDLKSYINENNKKGKPILMTDNNSEVFSWLQYYFLVFQEENPFGYSSRRIGDIFSGFVNDPYYDWKRHRTVDIPQSALSVAMANAKALQWLVSRGFKLKLED